MHGSGPSLYEQWTHRRVAWLGATGVIGAAILTPAVLSARAAAAAELGALAGGGVGLVVL